MRWQQLFADLEAQFEEAASAVEQGESASRARWELGTVSFTDRLRGAIGTEVRLTCRGAGQLGGVLVEVGPDWLLVVDEHGRECLVATAALTAVAGLVSRTAPAADDALRVVTDLRRAVRGLVRDRSPVTVVLADGTRFDGTADRVGADFAEFAEHPAGEPRRAAAVRAVLTVPLAALALLVRATEPAD